MAAAAMLPTETYPVRYTSAAHTSTATPSAAGVRPSITPAAVATPFPPLNPTNTENTCPTTATSPQTSANNSDDDTRGANTRTGTRPLAASSSPTGTANRQPSTR